MLDQILIRMGVDAKAVSLGLNQVSSLAKGWATGLAHELKGKLGGFLAAGFAIEAFGEIKNHILEIKRLSEETGASTNFVQGLMLKAAQAGLKFEDLTRPIAKFNSTIGQAKQGVPSAIKSLYDLGVINQHSAIGTLTMSSAMAKLAENIKNTEDASKRAAMLQQAFGKGAYKMAPLMEGGAAGINEMESGNIFTKISKTSIEDFSTLWKSIKAGSMVAATSIVNLIDVPLQGYKNIAKVIGIWSTGVIYGEKFKQAWEKTNESQEENAVQARFAAEAEKEGLTVEEAKLKLKQQLIGLTEQQLEIESSIADRNKLSIEAMAAHARKMLGIPEPKNYSVSSNDMLAMRISNLNKKAGFAFEKGDIQGGKNLTSEADNLRKGLGESISLKERDPLRSTNIQLEKVNEQLTPVKEAADLILGEHRRPK